MESLASMGTQPPVETLTVTDTEALISCLELRELGDYDFDLLILTLRLVLKLQDELVSKQASIARLRHLLFGPRSERRLPETPVPVKLESVSRLAEVEENTEPGPEPESETASAAKVVPLARKPRKGQGRLGARAYTGARVVRCLHFGLKPGDDCSDPLCRGHLYDTKTPQRVLRLEGRPPVDATHFERQRRGARPFRSVLPPNFPLVFPLKNTTRPQMW